ncbi:MAG: hypothetical protein GWN30_08490, partial [Gammaproteobacteria bacterium]|nr:hypothetical protein [Gammaproteobacteria bacterium]
DDGEGMLYFDSTVAGGAGDWSIDIPLPYYPYLTATSTDTSNNTSEFSAVFTLLVPSIDPNTSLTPDRTIATTGEILTYTLTMTNTGTASTSATYTNTIPTGTSWISDWDVSTG